jgi:hypothetical protein
MGWAPAARGGLIAPPPVSTDGASGCLPLEVPRNGASQGDRIVDLGSDGVGRYVDRPLEQAGGRSRDFGVARAGRPCAADDHLIDDAFHAPDALSGFPGRDARGDTGDIAGECDHPVPNLDGKVGIDARREEESSETVD